MKITATAAIPYAVVVLTPVELVSTEVTVVVAEIVCVDPEPETVTVVEPPLTVVVDVDTDTDVETTEVGTFWSVSATTSPGTPVPHVTSPAVIGKMTSIVPLWVAATVASSLIGPPM